MIIEDMQQSLELLENIKYFFYDIEETEKKLSAELYNKEGERDDLLHEIELSKLNAIEIMATYKKLEKVLQERRIIKDKIDLINTIKPYTSKFITKGICAVFETNKILNKTMGTYAKLPPSTGNALIDYIRVLNGMVYKFDATEYCTTTYNNEEFKLLKYSEDIWKQWRPGEEESKILWRMV